jgi:hypothetical protein
MRLTRELSTALSYTGRWQLTRELLTGSRLNACGGDGARTGALDVSTPGMPSRRVGVSCLSEQGSTDIVAAKMPVGDRVRLQWSRWLWLCPLLGVVAAAAILMVWGLTLWTAIGVALLLACPAILIWALLYWSRDEVRDRLLDEYRKRQKP